MYFFIKVSKLKIKKHQVYILLPLFLLPLNLVAQSSKVVSDFRTRTTIKVEKEFIKNLSGFTEFELSLEQDISRIGKIHAEAGIEFNPIKSLDIEAAYRFSKNRKSYSNNYKYTHTYAISAQYRKRFDLLKCYMRLQFKNIDDEAMEATSIEELRSIVKPRLKVKYDIWGTRISPYALSELYFSMKKFSFSPTKIKNIIGAEYSFYKKNEIAIYYRNDHEIKNYLPYTYHTMGISYCIKF